jgi:arylsulfatase A-like enzyme
MWTEATIKYIRENKDNPFFIYLAQNMPHDPWHASEPFKGSSSLGLYGDVIQELDQSLGSIVETLKELDLYDNTLIIFTSDNGPVIRFENGGTAGPLRGGKATTWEGGMRVPAIISWPDHIQGGIICREPVSTLDILPTLLNICGAENTNKYRGEGRNIKEILFQPQDSSGLSFEFMYYSRDGKPEAFRKGPWKVHTLKQNWKNNSGTPFPVSLYKLDEDISEQNNLASDYPDLVNELREEMNILDDKLQGKNN